jgi:hypothetical protein
VHVKVEIAWSAASRCLPDADASAASINRAAVRTQDRSTP